MTDKFTVKLTYTRNIQFEVDADSAYAAYTETREGFEYGDLRPDDDWSSCIELEGLQRGEVEIDVDHRYDWKAPKDDRGMTPTFAVARDATTLREVDRDHDLEALLERVFPAVESGEDTPQ